MTTRTRRSSADRTADLATRQITELAQAFRGFASSVPGLNVEVVGHLAGSRQFVHPVAGFHVRLPGEGGVGISLYVSSQYGELVRWRPGAGALRERFDVSIDETGYGWGGSMFPTAHELAHDLVAYMQFNLDALLKS
ncbi:hypothetical protein BH23GEM9_BH23GEM9_21610 [soil metagenome]